MPLPKKNLRILVTRTDRIGDLVLATPVFPALRKAYPQAFLAALCLKQTAPVLEGNPYLDELIVYDKHGKEKRWWQSALFGLKLRQKRFDVVVHLHPTNRIHLLSFLAGIPVRIGYRRNWSFLLTSAFLEEKQKGERHEAEYNFDLLKPLGVSIPGKLELYFPEDPGVKKAVRQKLLEKGLSEGKPYFVLHPSASCPSKRWPPERFAKIGHEIHTRFGLCPVLIGDAASREISASVLKTMEVKGIDLTGELSLLQLGALLRGSAFLVSNDTGPVHIAAALDVPVVSIFGRRDPGLSPQRWRPLGGKSFFLHRPPDCDPCLAHRCQIQFECLTNITVEDVLGLLQAKREVFGLREPREGKEQ